MKKCSKCGQEKPLDGYNRQKRNKDGFSNRCKICTRQEGLAHYHAHKATKNPERNERRRVTKYSRKRDLQKLYGITLERYDELFAFQSGLCAICSRPERQLDVRYGTPIYLAVDHDHNTGQIRGLLCSACNVAIGKMNDSPEQLRKAADYLEKQRPPDEPGASAR